MRNLAPEIMRQRLLVEGFYDTAVDADMIRSFFAHITAALSLQVYGEAVVFATGARGREENQGYDAFVPLIDSGISVYIWCQQHFLSLIIYTCKLFDERLAVSETQRFFGLQQTEWMSF